MQYPETRLRPGRSPLTGKRRLPDDARLDGRIHVIQRSETEEIADKEVAALPRDSNYIRVRHRCAITSRPRGVVFKWRLSRIVWRHLADYNKLAGVQRAMW
ncbi:hypothetical protein ANN_25822 [Periplaneta americana]|uniref:28S ribosomal protein S14, mitochondrial n=1 Tax=Periplaneta americana TaxID=6978 RepID=A0ABQ8S483_PERAM|nr:hypothetical protein ANN_25822 [Periplaneta americana]